MALNFFLTLPVAMDWDKNSILIEKLRQGKEDAFLLLVNLYRDKLITYATMLVKNPSLAEDMVQEVFLRTWEYRKKLNPKLSIQSFLYKGVYNEFINGYKKGKALSKIEERYVEAINNILVENNDNDLKEKIDLINAAIEDLPDRCKEIFELSKREGLTNREISDYLKISIKTVEGQISKAFRTIRSKLKSKPVSKENITRAS